MKTPAIVLNMKTYSQATGKAALKLAKICDEVAKDKGASIVICPQLADAQKIVESVDIPVFAQHVDDVDPGSHTGWVLIEIPPEFRNEYGGIRWGWAGCDVEKHRLNADPKPPIVPHTDR